MAAKHYHALIAYKDGHRRRGYMARGKFRNRNSAHKWAALRHPDPRDRMVIACEDAYGKGCPVKNWTKRQAPSQRTS